MAVHSATSSVLHKELKPFATRIRVARGWRAAFISLTLASASLFLLLAVFALRKLELPVVSRPAVAAGILVTIALSAAVVAMAQSLPTRLVANSLERRAKLKNALTATLDAEESAFQQPILSQSREDLARLDPKRFYPLSWGVWQWTGMALLAACIAASIYFPKLIPVVYEPTHEKTVDTETVAKVERVLAPLKERPRNKLTAQQISQEQSLEKLLKDLQSGHADKNDAVKAANQEYDKAKQMELKTAEKVKNDINMASNMSATSGSTLKSQAAAMQQQMQKEGEAQLSNLDQKISQLQKQIAQASGPQKESLEKQLRAAQQQRGAASKSMQEEQKAFDEAQQEGKMDEKHIQDALNLTLHGMHQGENDPLAELAELRRSLTVSLQNQIAGLKERLKTATGEEAKKLRDELKKLEDQLAEAKQALADYQKHLQQAIDAANADLHAPEFHDPKPTLHPNMDAEMKQAMGKMMKAIKKVEEGKDLTPSESAEMKKLTKQMAEKAASAGSGKGSAEKKITAQVLASAAEALSEGENAVSIAMQMQGMFGTGAPGDSNLKEATGHVNMRDKPAKGLGKSHGTEVDPLRGDGPSTYIEVRGPATLGNKGGVPYRKVLPAYAQKAEQAIQSSQISKKQQKRVRAYFDALRGE